MSTYSECGDAARRLLDDPSLRITTRGPKGLFTDLDVILLAAREAALIHRPYSEDRMRVAAREASQIMGGYFRSGRAVRFGPVDLPGIKGLDYMRIEGKIVYAPAEGPASVRTPNGSFSRMYIQDDPIKQAGRRQGTARNDLEPWKDQDLLARSPAQVGTARQYELAHLRAEVTMLREQLEQSQAENERLRAQSVTRAEVENLLSDRLGDRETH